jgi:hypothetical protein
MCVACAPAIQPVRWSLLELSPHPTSSVAKLQPAYIPASASWGASVFPSYVLTESQRIAVEFRICAEPRRLCSRRATSHAEKAPREPITGASSRSSRLCRSPSSAESSNRVTPTSRWRVSHWEQCRSVQTSRRTCPRFRIRGGRTTH